MPPARPRSRETKPKRGSFDDTEGWPLRFDSMDGFLRWKADLEKENGVQFNRGPTHQPEGKVLSGGLPLFKERIRFECARNGRPNQAPRKHTDKYNRKVPTKKLGYGGCHARIQVKTFHERSEVVARITGDHDHPTGAANVKYCRISQATRDLATGLIALGVALPEVMRQLEENFPIDSSSLTGEDIKRDDLVTYDFLRRIKTEMDGLRYRQDGNDAVSVHRWVAKLRKLDCILDYHQAGDPHDSIDSEDFSLIIQTPWQRRIFAETGEYVLCMDGTHNTQVYGYTLFTLLSRDKYGHGVPVAYMISSRGTERVLTHFLRLFRDRNTMTPHVIMTDYDVAQINALRSVYPDVPIYLCWWHVLRAWKKHLPQAETDQIWPLMTAWLRESDAARFSNRQSEIFRLASPNYVQYLTKTWLPVITMWSAVHRTNRRIEEHVDTNMLIEAWHSVLKMKFMEGKRNRRMDNLVYLLTNPINIYYVKKYFRQQMGLEGADLAVQARLACKSKAEEVPKDSIQPQPGDLFLVTSSSDASIRYSVNLAVGTCSCPYFQRDGYCKHETAVRIHFEESEVPLAPGPSWAPPPTPLPDASIRFPSPEPSAGAGDGLHEIEEGAGVGGLEEFTPAMTPSYNPAVQWDAVLAQVLKVKSEAHHLSTETVQEVEELLGRVLHELGERKAEFPSPQKLPPHIRSSVETGIAMGYGMPRKKKRGRPATTSAANFFKDMYPPKEDPDPRIPSPPPSPPPSTPPSPPPLPLPPSTDSEPQSSKASLLPPPSGLPLPIEFTNSQCNQDYTPSAANPQTVDDVQAAANAALEELRRTKAVLDTLKAKGASPSTIAAAKEPYLNAFRSRKAALARLRESSGPQAQASVTVPPRLSPSHNTVAAPSSPLHLPPPSATFSSGQAPLPNQNAVFAAYYSYYFSSFSQGMVPPAPVPYPFPPES
ncbi:hypothetical protein FRC05_003458 [Tulasnella sp. 425]|nr:hypothetical protein FRC05_003458 [Tulasnella sp. 425]